MYASVSYRQRDDERFYFLLPCERRSVVSNSLRPHGLYSPWNSPGQNTGVGSLSLHQGVFPTQGSNPGLPHCRKVLYQLSHKGSPRILEWVAFPFSSRSSRPRNRTGVSCMAGGFFTNWAIREAHGILHSTKKKWAIKTWTMMKTEMHITQWNPAFSDAFFTEWYAFQFSS